MQQAGQMVFSKHAASAAQHGSLLSQKEREGEREREREREIYIFSKHAEKVLVSTERGLCICRTQHAVSTHNMMAHGPSSTTTQALRGGRLSPPPLPQGQVAGF
jgi:hypothetical protein